MRTIEAKYLLFEILMCIQEIMIIDEKLYLGDSRKRISKTTMLKSIQKLEHLYRELEIVYDKPPIETIDDGELI